MSDYTPSTEQVRGGFAASPMAHEPREYAEAEFDRWLARHDAEQQEKGVRLAAEYLRNEMDEPWGMRFASHLEAHSAGIVLEAP
jgi:hypothetical protein